jgi:hypothetical protein
MRLAALGARGDEKGVGAGTLAALRARLARLGGKRELPIENCKLKIANCQYDDGMSLQFAICNWQRAI